MSDTNKLTENEVRALRNAVYGTGRIYGTDSGWESCKENWMKPENIRWLQSQPQNQTGRAIYGTH